MLNKREFLKEEKECANMLGMNLEEYRKSIKSAKASNKNSKNKNYKYDNSILKKLGLSKSNLKIVKIY